jgi:VWFA-related protein
MKWKIVLALLVGSVFAQTPAHPPDQFFQHSYALVIGIDRYPKWPQLQYAVKDARAITAFLQTQNYDQVITLYDQQATKQAIISAMQDQLAQKLKSKDRVLIFFAGHGYTDTVGGKDRGYIVPFDGDTQRASYISMDELENLADYMGNARHQLFIMDSCYGGMLGVTRAGLVNPNIPDYLNNITDRIARQVLTAGGKNQQVLDGGPKGHSVFVDYLLEALADGKADTNGDGYITFSELTAYLIPRASNHYQTPTSSVLAGNQGGEFLFRSPQGRLVAAAPGYNPAKGIVRGAVEPAASPPAKEPAPIAEPPPNKVANLPATNAMTRKLEVSVLDDHGKLIPNIPRDNFRVIEDREPRTIMDFSDAGSSTVAILLQYNNTLRMMSTYIINHTESLIDRLGPKDWISLVSYDIKPKVLLDFTVDHASLLTALNQLPQLSTFNQSNLYDALADLASRMKPIKGQKAIIVFTDGVDTFSKLTSDQTIEAVKAAGIPIYAIKLERTGSPEAETFLQTVTAATGGKAFFATTSPDFTNVCSAIAGALSSNPSPYQISYQMVGPQDLLDTSSLKVDLVNSQTHEPLKMLDKNGAEIHYKVVVSQVP